MLPAGWKFYSAEASHERTEQRWADGKGGVLKLTGEPAGRQTWVRGAAGEEEEEGDEPLPTFNPSVNPNSGDKLMRAQQVSGEGKEKEGQRERERETERRRRSKGCRKGTVE